ncbi:MAG: mechanosensitive ion channel family protein, partial [Actinomycetota bacterium]
SVRDLFVSAVTLLPRLASAVILALLFWLVARVAGRLVCAAADRTGLDPNLRQLGRAVAYYGAWAVGVVAILATFGFQTGGIVAALGISGFILGFAFKDILSHFLAGLMLLMGRQFRIGDQIVVKEQEGTVERIELRALHLRTYDNRLVIIPNAEVFNSIITSNTASPHRRREFVVGIGYEQDIGRALRVAHDTVAATPGVLQEPAPDVLVDSLSPSTVDLRIRFFMNSLRADYLKVGSECMRRVKEAFETEGVSMPSPIQTVVFANVSDMAKEVAQTVSDGRRELKERPRRAA